MISKLNPVLNFFYPVRWVNKSSPEQKALANSQTAFYNNLTDKFNQQFEYQRSILDYLQTQMKPLIESPSGFLPGEEAALRTDATEQNTSAFQNAIRSFQNRSFVMGGREVPGGAMMAGIGSLLNQQAANQSAAQRAITMQGAQLKRQNMFNAASILSNAAGMVNPAQYASTAVNAGSTAYSSVKDAYQPSNLLGNILGGVAGAAMNYFLPGSGMALGSIMKPGQISGAFGGPTSVATQDASSPWVIS